MIFSGLKRATLVKRYKRFLADVTLDNGEQLTVHCPNTGAMTGCAEPGFAVWLSSSDNPKRKYPNTWELLQTLAGDRACIHSAKANQLVREALEKNHIPELSGYPIIQSEVKYGEENSRIDLLLQRDQERCFIEVKSVTLLLDEGLGVFPDTVSDRGRKHLRELIAMVGQGHRAVLLFCVQHTGIQRVAPADLIDRKYADTFREARAAGVEVLAYGVSIKVNEHDTVANITLQQPLSVLDCQP